MNKEAMTLAKAFIEDTAKYLPTAYDGAGLSIVKALEEALAKLKQDKPYGYVRADGSGLFIYGEHQFQNTTEVELLPVYLHPKQEQGEPSYAERLLAHVEDFAKRCGWSKESGEGAFECVQRTSYAQGVEDGKLQRSQEQDAPVAWGVDWGKDGQQSCVSIAKRTPNGDIEVVAVEYNPTPSQPKQEQGEPVAWMDIDEKGAASGLRYWSEPNNRHEAPLYTTPQPAQKPWVGIDDEEIRQADHRMVEGAYHHSFKQGVRWGEEKLKERNT